MSAGDLGPQLTAAERALAVAETMPEVLAIKNVAEAARVFAKQARLSLDTTNRACLVRLHAEARAAELLQRMQDRGELADKGRPKMSSTLTFFADAGIDRREAHIWARVARATVEQRRTYAQDATAAGEEVTRTGLAQWLARLDPPLPAETPTLPPGRYRCVVIDPPWPMEKIEREVRADQGLALDYPTLPVFDGQPNDDGEPQDIEHVAAVPLVAADEGCHVYLWATQHFVPDALRLFEVWGVRYECVLTWVKPTGPTPFSWMYSTEHVLFGRVGNLPLERKGIKLHFEAPAGRGQHSRKPDVFYERVLDASPAPRLEMFARTRREGFDPWGNEVVDEQ